MHADDASLEVHAGAAAALERRQTVTLPAYSISLIGPLGRVEFQPQPPTTKNLLTGRPDLTLWHEPFSTHQPEFDDHGVYTVELGYLAGQKMAILKMEQFVAT